MGLGLPEQPDSGTHIVGDGQRYKNLLHRQKNLRWWHFQKRWQLRRERRRAKANPECWPEYGKCKGYE